MRPLDAGALAAAEAAGLGALGRWLAGVSGAVPPRVVERSVAVPGGAPPPLAVPAVAAAVDRGRALAAAAAADGVTVLVARGGPAPGPLVAWLGGARTPGAPEDAPRGPLAALRRLAGEGTAVLCGVALGAGEHGVGLLCDGLDAAAAAAIAVAVEPDVRPWVLAADAADGPVHASLLARLGVPVVARSGGSDAALTALRAASDGRAT